MYKMCAMKFGTELEDLEDFGDYLRFFKCNNLVNFNLF